MKKAIAALLSTCIIFLVCVEGARAYAAGSTLTVSGNIYDLDKDSHYVFGEASPANSAAIGELLINGDLRTSVSKNSFPAYKANSGNITFTYKVASNVFNHTENDWHIVDDKSKKVNGLALDKNILSGALILQTSLDGVVWAEDVLMSDIFSGNSTTDDFFTTKDIQLQNGCYYRVIIAYKMERRQADSKVLFVTAKNYEYKQVAEVYEFYIFGEADETSPDATPMKKLGSKINTGKDNGYSGNEPIDKDDPHYGWDIGYFYVNGYTRETSIGQTPVFLKNVGDKVTLWFHLSEDITKLRGNEHLTVSEDVNGYDRNFEIEQTNFKHGALIIQYTNSQGEAQTPVIYTDYLAANARTGADTKVQLFEEGDYVVSLDYELKSMGGPFNQIASYTNYKIIFEFSIRNGNCMVFPFDISTGAELANNAITENGFKLDMAKSKYLTIDVQRSVLTAGTDGLLTEDVRFNRPAKDGETYSGEGIYIFKVTNLYTHEHTVKTVYVGSSCYLKALSINGMSVSELNDEVLNGAIIHDDGTVEAALPSAEPQSTEPPVKAELVQESPVVSSPAYVVPTETPNVNTDISPDAEERIQERNIMPLIVIASIVVVVILSFLIAKRRQTSQLGRNEEACTK